MVHTTLRTRASFNSILINLEIVAPLLLKRVAGASKQRALPINITDSGLCIKAIPVCLSPSSLLP